MRTDPSSSLRFLDQRDENRGQLIGFVLQRCQFLARNDARVLEQFEPIERLLQFHQTTVHFRDIFGGRTTADRLAVVSTDRSSATKQLSCQNTGSASLRQRVVHLDDSQRVASGSIFQVLHRCIKPETRKKKPEKTSRPSGFELRCPVLVSGLKPETRNQKPETRKNLPGFWFRAS